MREVDGVEPVARPHLERSPLLLKLFAAPAAADIVASSDSEVLPTRSDYDKLLVTARLGINAHTESGDVCDPTTIRGHLASRRLEWPDPLGPSG
jgi:hypothetical protein